ncbi:MAG: chromosome segregation protein ParM [Corticimicrobacter sp.]|uniref:chromosome segregation protein ParM n=1 Tax=Corticimicrobacter sp. TaxID=2678536 RepID=UPI0032DADB2E
MAEMGSRETELTKTISGAERDRRVAAVNYARSLVGLEGFSLSAADENMLNGSSTGTMTSKYLCNRVVPWQAQKLSHDEENIGG